MAEPRITIRGRNRTVQIDNHYENLCFLYKEQVAATRNQNSFLWRASVTVKEGRVVFVRVSGGRKGWIGLLDVSENTPGTATYTFVTGRGVTCHAYVYGAPGDTPQSLREQRPVMRVMRRDGVECFNSNLRYLSVFRYVPRHSLLNNDIHINGMGRTLAVCMSNPCILSDGSTGPGATGGIGSGGGFDPSGGINSDTGNLGACSMNESADNLTLTSTTIDIPDIYTNNCTTQSYIIADVTNHN